MVPETERVTVGTIGKPHGLDGTVVLHPETDNPNRFIAGATIQVDSGKTDSGRLLTVRSVRSSEAVLLVSFVDINDRDAAETLRGVTLSIDPSERRSLSADEFWPEDLIGLEARDSSGNAIGSIKAVDADSPQSRLTIATAHGDFIVPLVTALVPEVNLAGGYLVVEPIEGLLSP
jgi:16S rRNA processing protein RimM